MASSKVNWTPKKNRRKCSAKNCSKNTIENIGLALFTFPTDPIRRKQWLDKVQTADPHLKLLHLCEYHFKPSDIFSGEKKRLRKNAIPADFNFENVRSHFPPPSPEEKPFQIQLPSLTPSFFQSLLPSNPKCIPSYLPKLSSSFPTSASTSLSIPPPYTPPSLPLSLPQSLLSSLPKYIPSSPAPSIPPSIPPSLCCSLAPSLTLPIPTSVPPSFEEQIEKLKARLKTKEKLLQKHRVKISKLKKKVCTLQTDVTPSKPSRQQVGVVNMDMLPKLLEISPAAVQFVLMQCKVGKIQDLPPPEDNKPHSLIVTEDVQEVNLHVQADLSNTDIQATKSKIQNDINILKGSSSANNQPTLISKSSNILANTKMKPKKNCLNKNIIEEEGLDSDDLESMIQNPNIVDEKILVLESDEAIFKRKKKKNPKKRTESFSTINSDQFSVIKQTCVICKTDFDCTRQDFKNHVATHLVYEINTHKIVSLDGKILINMLDILESVKGFTQNDNTPLTNNGDQQPFCKDTEHHNLEEIVCSQSKSANQVSEFELQDQIIKDNLSESSGHAIMLKELHISLSDFTHCCKICNLKVMNYEQLNLHKQTKHSDKKSKYDAEKLNIILRNQRKICPKCGKTFPHNGMTKHLEWHANEHQHQCDICALDFVSKCGLQRHKKQSHSVDQHGNPVCLKNHVCEFCGKCYSTQTAVKQHAYKNHLNEKIKISCGRCKVTFSSIIQHQEHCEKKHPSLQLSKGHCDICNRSFNTVSGLKNHQLRRHFQTLGKKDLNLGNLMQAVQGDLIKCSQCDKVFKHRLNCQTHIQIQHGPNPRPYPCHCCAKAYTSKQSRDFHYKTVHLGQPLPCCKVCNKTFADLSNLRLHMMIHRDERPHECDICHQKFRHNYQLKIHRTIHSGEKPWPCRVCGVKFRVIYDRTVHEKRHIKRGEATLEDLVKAQTVTSGQPGGSTHSDGHSGDQPTGGEYIDNIESCSSIV